MADKKGMPKKKKLSDYIMWYIGGVAVFILTIWGGYVLEATSNKRGVQVLKALEEFEEYINVSSFLKAINAIFFGNGTTMYAALLGTFAGGLIILYPLARRDKKYHRRGEEHGSARWGRDSEKKIVADVNDFYNNVILGADIFLVLDRKKRERNLLTSKELKKQEKDEKRKQAREKKRAAELEKACLKAFSPVGNYESDFLIEGKCLKRYLGNDNYVIIPSHIDNVGSFAFANTSVVEIEFPDQSVSIGKGAFYNCQKLKKIVCASIPCIHENAFENCFFLESFEVKKDVSKVSEYAFEKCNLIEFEVKANTQIHKYALNNGYSIKIPDDKIETVENEKISINSVVSKSSTAQKIQPMLSLNTMILGGTGTGKSRFNVIPNLLQCNTSFAITDPSGELLRDCGMALKRNGYKIKVFNLNSMSHSCNYNPFHYLKDSNGEYNENSVIKMINVFIANTDGENKGGNKDPFWDNSAKVFLAAICFLLIETADESQQNFATVLDLLHKEKVVDGREEEKSELAMIFEERKRVAPNALSVKYYTEFRQGAGKTMQSVLMTVSTKLQNFNLDEVRNLTSTDNIRLEEIGDEKTALFIIISSTDDTYNFLAAIMYTQLFDTLYERAMVKYHGRLPYHVRFLMDEFANIGKVPGFDKVLATCRKFEISATIILQNLSQLKSMYEKDWQALPGNCDTIIFLGGKDQFTNEYISKDLGKETIDTLAINQTKARQGSSTYNNGIQGRDLMTIDELSTLPNNECIVMIRGLHPFRVDKFDVKNHPRYNMLRECDEIKNSFYVEDNITTLPEIEYIDFTDFYDDDELIFDGFEDIEIQYQTADGEKIIPVSEADSLINVSADINDIFDKTERIHYKIA